MEKFMVSTKASQVTVLANSAAVFSFGAEHVNSLPEGDGWIGDFPKKFVHRTSEPSQIRCHPFAKTRQPFLLLPGGEGRDEGGLFFLRAIFPGNRHRDGA
jgi:hypothetical protein